MSIIRTLKHFTQDEVDKAVTETLAKDLPYGGNRPYVIGTILRDQTNGEYITWKRPQDSQEHRVCIEHEPDEFVVWKAVPAGTQSVEIPLTQLGESGLGEVKRVGFVQLAQKDYAIASSAIVRPGDFGTADEKANSPLLHFFKPRTSPKIDQGFAALADGNGHEVEPLVFKPLYLTHSVFVSDCLLFNDTVFYCVYKKHSGLLEGEIQMMTHSTYGEISFYDIRVPARKWALQYAIASVVNLNETETVEVVSFYGTKITPGGVYVGDVFSVGGNNGFSPSAIGNSTIDAFWVNPNRSNDSDYCYDIRGFVTINNTIRARGKVLLQIKHYPE
jgi:hypothetical protein